MVGGRVSARGDRERDLAAVEREWAYENRRRSSHADEKDELTYRRLADLHTHVAGLLEELAGVYDEIDAITRRGR